MTVRGGSADARAPAAGAPSSDAATSRCAAAPARRGISNLLVHDLWPLSCVCARLLGRVDTCDTISTVIKAFLFSIELNRPLTDGLIIFVSTQQTLNRWKLYCHVGASLSVRMWPFAMTLRLWQYPPPKALSQTTIYQEGGRGRGHEDEERGRNREG